MRSFESKLSKSIIKLALRSLSIILSSYSNAFELLLSNKICLLLVNSFLHFSNMLISARVWAAFWRALISRRELAANTFYCRSFERFHAQTFMCNFRTVVHYLWQKLGIKLHGCQCNENQYYVMDAKDFSHSGLIMFIEYFGRKENIFNCRSNFVLFIVFLFNSCLWGSRIISFLYCIRALSGNASKITASYV